MILNDRFMYIGRDECVFRVVFGHFLCGFILFIKNLHKTSQNSKNARVARVKILRMSMNGKEST